MDIVEFYIGKRPNQSGYYIGQILNFSDEQLEKEHTYIQWLFPLVERSQAVLSSPTITTPEIDLFHHDAHLKQLVIKSLIKMLDFYGLEFDADSEIAFIDKSHNHSLKSQWYTNPKYSHNFLRITRILKSLILLDLKLMALLFYDSLIALANEFPQYFPKKTLNFWRETIKTANSGQ